MSLTTTSRRSYGVNPIMSWLALLLLGGVVGWAIAQPSSGTTTSKHVTFQAEVCSTSSVSHTDKNGKVLDRVNVLNTSQGQIIAPANVKVELSGSTSVSTQLVLSGVYSFTVWTTPRGPYELISYKPTAKPKASPAC